MPTLDEIRTNLADVDEAGAQGWSKATALARALINAGDKAVEKRGALASMDEQIDRVLYAAAELRGVREALAATLQLEEDKALVPPIPAGIDEEPHTETECGPSRRCRVCGGDELVSVQVCVQCSGLASTP